MTVALYQGRAVEEIGIKLHLTLLNELGLHPKGKSVKIVFWTVLSAIAQGDVFGGGPVPDRHAAQAFLADLNFQRGDAVQRLTPNSLATVQERLAQLEQPLEFNPAPAPGRRRNYARPPEPLQQPLQQPLQMDPSIRAQVQERLAQFPQFNPGNQANAVAGPSNLCDPQPPRATPNTILAMEQRIRDLDVPRPFQPIEQVQHRRNNRAAAPNQAQQPANPPQPQIPQPNNLGQQQQHNPGILPVYFQPVVEADIQRITLGRMNVLYFYSTAEANQARMRRNPLNPQVMGILDQVLRENHAYIPLFKTALERLHEQKQAHPEVASQFYTTIHCEKGTDPRRYNAPTADEVAVVLPGDGSHATNYRDLILNYRGGGLKRIYEYNASYQPMVYVLLFPYGENGWHPGIPLNLPDGDDEDVDEEQEDRDAAGYRFVAYFPGRKSISAVDCQCMGCHRSRQIDLVEEQSGEAQD
ncbi:hypothetical protein DFH08DRAFT_821375 [Mycena albidolilacea]|uniref:Uncharacterized protein n=1 Tax=Mycena albidolilacea TaxID=1033008 RepID=A0AAD6Z9Y7_9AGAR|nr:hypothetical protein DFH08DRAFT_821375 [Mycena albidolilacea]